MAPSLRSSAVVALGLAAFTISGSTPSPSPPTPPRVETSMWAWRHDMDHGTEVTYDLSGEYQEHGMNGGCARESFAYTVGECRPDDPSMPWEHTSPCVENNKTFVEYMGKTGVKTYNLNHDQAEYPVKRGCLWRKSRVPIDLSKIDRIELDLETTPKGCCGDKAPWYAVWLVPMNYSDINDSAKAAEIDLIENYDQNHRGEDVNIVKSNLAQCGEGVYQQHCHNVGWSVSATDINHHITVQATHDPVDGRVINIHHCTNPEGGAKLDTCPQDSPSSWIKVEKAPPVGVQREKWFPIWNKDLVGANYAHYWLQTDQWWTSGTEFALSVDNVRFFLGADGSEWEMPLDYGADNDLGVYSENHLPAGHAEVTSEKAEPRAFETVV